MITITSNGMKNKNNKNTYLGVFSFAQENVFLQGEGSAKREVFFMKEIQISKIQEKFGLEIIAGEKGLSRTIASEDIHRPGLEMTGFYSYFPKERIQIIGLQEMTYFSSLPFELQQSRLQEYAELDPPCVILSRNLQYMPCFKTIFESYDIPLLRTPDKTTNFISELNNYLEKELAQEVGIHGVCVNVFGVGILIKGKSGIGKSEIVLSLIERGHRLIADDLVILKKIGPVALIGTHNQYNKDILSLRGIGLVHIPRLYGSGSVQDETKINLEIELTPWEDGVYYDGVRMVETTTEYLGIRIPQITLPISSGRDMASLIEVAAKNWRLHAQGYNTFEDFQSRLDSEQKE